MDIRKAVETLCPDLFTESVDLALSHILDNRLIQHGALRKANYRLKFPADKSTEMDALWTILPLMHRCMVRNGYIALASTQLGLSFPVISFLRAGEGFGAIFYPRIQASDKRRIYRFEGCGSLKLGTDLDVKYITWYYKVINLTYRDIQGKPKSEKLLSEDWKIYPVDKFIDSGVAQHELRHLLGKTAANGYLIDPKKLTDRMLNELALKLAEFYRYENPDPMEQLKQYFNFRKNTLAMLVPKLVGGFRIIGAKDYI